MATALEEAVRPVPPPPHEEAVRARPDIRVEYSKTWQTALAVLMEGRKEKCKVYNRHNRLVSLTGELEQRDFPLKVVFLEEVASIVYCPNWEIILESFLESSDLEDYIILDRSNKEFLLDSANRDRDCFPIRLLAKVKEQDPVFESLEDRLNLGHSVSMRLIVPLDASSAPMKTQGTLAKIEDDLFEILHGDEASFTGARNLIHSIFEQAGKDETDSLLTLVSIPGMSRMPNSFPSPRKTCGEILPLVEEGNLITAQVRPQEKLEFRVAVGLDVLSAKGLPEVLVSLYKLDDEDQRGNALHFYEVACVTLPHVAKGKSTKFEDSNLGIYPDFKHLADDPWFLCSHDEIQDLMLEVNNARDEAAFNRENLGSQSSLVQNTACMGGDLQLGGGASFTHEGLVHRKAEEKVSELGQQNARLQQDELQSTKQAVSKLHEDFQCCGMWVHGEISVLREKMLAEGSSKEAAAVTAEHAEKRVAALEQELLVARAELSQMKDLDAGFVHPTRLKEERLANHQTVKGPDAPARQKGVPGDVMCRHLGGARFPPPRRTSDCREKSKNRGPPRPLSAKATSSLETSWMRPSKATRSFFAASGSCAPRTTSVYTHAEPVEVPRLEALERNALTCTSEQRRSVAGAPKRIMTFFAPTVGPANRTSPGSQHDVASRRHRACNGFGFRQAAAQSAAVGRPLS
eukprot:s1496_g5.t1